jgi:hypothetical protein
MSEKWAQDAILEALEQRILKLERELVTSPGCSINEDLDACRSLRVKLNQNFSNLDVDKRMR